MLGGNVSSRRYLCGARDFGEKDESIGREVEIPISLLIYLQETREKTSPLGHGILGALCNTLD